MLPLLCVGMSSDYTLRSDPRFLDHVVKFLHNKELSYNYRRFSHSSPMCSPSQMHMSCAASTTTQSVLYQNWFTPFSLPKMSSHLFLPFSFWQRPTHILWHHSEATIFKKPSQILPLLGSLRALNLPCLSTCLRVLTMFCLVLELSGYFSFLLNLFHLSIWVIPQSSLCSICLVHIGVSEC